MINGVLNKKVQVAGKTIKQTDIFLFFKGNMTTWEYKIRVIFNFYKINEIYYLLCKLYDDNDLKKNQIYY